MNSIVKAAKTIDEAVDLALEELGGSRDNFEMEVLEEPSKGIFGLIGSKDAVVRVTIKDRPISLASVFLSDLFTSMNIKADFNMKMDDNVLYVEVVNISSSDTGVIIGRRGDTLDAIQYLLSLAVNKQTDNYVRILLDTNGYRKKREEALISLAHRMGEKVKSSRKSIRLEPMNPYERKIIHSALQQVNGIETRSDGEEPYRRVVIYLSNNI